jgi:hypothetical protein
MNLKLCKEETILELKTLGARSIHRMELLADSRKVVHLGFLCYGIDWMITQLQYLVGPSGPKGSSSQNYTIHKQKGIIVIRY